MELISFLENMSIAAERIIICHVDRSVKNINEKLNIAKTGVFLECDTIARFKYHSDEAEVSLLKYLCGEGFEDRILLGLDTTRERLTSYGGSTGLDYILKNFLPLLKNTGLSVAQIQKMCIANPAAALSFYTNTI